MTENPHLPPCSLTSVVGDDLRPRDDLVPPGPVFSNALGTALQNLAWGKTKAQVTPVGCNGTAWETFAEEVRGSTF